MTETEEPTGMCHLLEAIQAVIKAADPAQREALAKTMDAYREYYPEDFYWAIGGQAPALLQNLMRTIEAACHSDERSRQRLLRLVDRKFERSV